MEAGDRPWAQAGRETIDELASEVRDRAKALDRKGDADDVHDMRTATRRLRTAVALYGAGAPKGDRRDVEKELKRVTRRLGVVRDLDILLSTLDGSAELDALRRAWSKERRAGERRLTAELDRRRFDVALERALELPGAADHEPVQDRVGTRAPGLIWMAFGRLLAYTLDPKTADPPSIHRMRIAAKKLRYTLEAFEDAVEPGARFIDDVKAVQDAAGAMHDAIVAAERARSTLDPGKLSDHERTAIDTFADAQLRRAEDQRQPLDRSLRRVRQRSFREDLGRAVAEMGRIDPAR